MSAPQLSGDGAELLASVLKKREEDHHDTLSAKRHARRLESDALLASPLDRDDEIVAQVVDTGDEHISVEGVPNAADSDTDNELDLNDASSQFGTLLLAVGCAAVVMVCTLLVASLEGQPGITETADPEIESVEAAPEAEVAGAVEENTSIANDSIVPVVEESTEEPAEVIETVQEPELTLEADARSSIPADSSSEGADVRDVVSNRAVPEAFEVTVYDGDPAAGNMHSFALRIKNNSAGEEVPTDDFNIFVANGEDAIVATTLTHFLHETVPEGTSALATVRAEDAGRSGQFVYVLLDGVQLARLPIQ